MLLGMCVSLALTTTLAANSVLKILTPLPTLLMFFNRLRKKCIKLKSCQRLITQVVDVNSWFNFTPASEDRSEKYCATIKPLIFTCENIVTKLIPIFLLKLFCAKKVFF